MADGRSHKWSKAQHAKHAATIKAKAAKRGRADFVTDSTPTNEAPDPPRTTLDQDPPNVVQPTQVLDPLTLEQQMDQIVRSVRTRTIHELRHSILSLFDEILYK